MPDQALVIPFLDGLPPRLVMLLSLGLLLVAAVLVQLIIQRFVLSLLGRVMRRMRGNWDDAVFERRVFHRLAWAVSLVLIQFGLPLVPYLDADTESLIQRVAAALMVVVFIRTIGAMIGAGGDIYEQHEVSRERPIKGMLQAVTLVIYLLGAIIAVATLLDKSPWLMLSGLGVLASVLMLVFRDTILSFVAGTQLTANQLIRVGDWIEMPQFGADGDVIDMTLNSVLVRNWDKTVTAIPAHKFLENSFKNWRGMQESGGRRIMRSMHIDMSSVRFLGDEEIARFKRFVLLRDYMLGKEDELDRYNEEHCPDPSFIANARRLTNVGTFRAYVTNYLRQHPGVHQEMTFLVRQLEPTPQGLPLQIYIFTNTTAWAEYEGIQGDIFDHLLAIIPEFGLRVFQEPSGNDLVRLGRARAGMDEVANPQQLKSV